MKKYLFILFFIFYISSLSFGQTISDGDIDEVISSEESMKDIYQTLKKQARALLEKNRIISSENDLYEEKKSALVEELRVLSDKESRLQAEPLRRKKKIEKLKERAKDLAAEIKDTENQIVSMNSNSLSDQKKIFDAEKKNSDLMKTLSNISQQKDQMLAALHSQPRFDAREFGQQLDQLKRDLLKSQNELKQEQKEFQEKQEALSTLKAMIRDSLNQNLSDESFKISSFDENPDFKEIVDLKKDFDQTSQDITSLFKKAEKEGLFLDREAKETRNTISFSYSLTDFRYQKQKLLASINDLESEIEDLKQRPERERFERDQKIIILQKDIAGLKEQILKKQNEQEEIICEQEDKLLTRVEDLKVINLSLSSQVFDLNRQIQKTEKQRATLSGLLSTTTEASPPLKPSENDACKDVECDRPNNSVLPKSLFKTPEILK
ncbi:MAG: hypothetical protein PHY73_00835 [Candidatus Omnitrophica bacterium]|nr:hypothetical protein [Candidatus Omnitrophota bacterium]